MVTGCYESRILRKWFWTAGQRIDPSRESTFVWRVTSSDASCDRLSTMTYTNWNRGEPNYGNRVESCMHLGSGRSYIWNDVDCGIAICSVCEIDL